MRYTFIITCYFLVLTFHSLGQQVLIYSHPEPTYTELNKIALLNIGEKASLANITIQIAENPDVFNEEELAKYDLVCFLNTGINSLSLRESTELERYFKAGGGFVGIHACNQTDTKWLWFEKFLVGKLTDQQPETPQLSNLITNLYIGKAKVPILWKLNDKPLFFQKLPFDCKPVIMDLGGNVLSWYHVSEYGNKMFYTALGGDSLAYANEDFLNHILSAMQEVAATNGPDYSKVAGEILPEKSDFSTISLSDTLNQAKSFSIAPNGNILIIEQNGRLLEYNVLEKKWIFCGIFPDLINTIYLKHDPDFNENGYVYCFQENGENEYLVRRLSRHKNGSEFILTDFSQISNSKINYTTRFQAALNEGNPFAFPIYYDQKVFGYDPITGIEVTTYGSLNKLLNIEPFVASPGNFAINSMEFNTDGTLILLGNSKIVKIYYSNGRSLPEAYIEADNLKGIVPFEVQFDAKSLATTGPESEITYNWYLNDEAISNQKSFKYTFKNPSVYQVKLEVSNGVSVDWHQVEIQCEARNKKK